MAMTSSQLPKLAKLSELFALNLSPDGKSLVGIGVSRALDTAQGLLDMHFKKLPQYAQMAMHEEQLKRQLKQTEQQKSYGSKVESVVKACVSVFVCIYDGLCACISRSNLRSTVSTWAWLSVPMATTSKRRRQFPVCI